MRSQKSFLQFCEEAEDIKALVQAASLAAQNHREELVQFLQSLAERDPRIRDLVGQTVQDGPPVPKKRRPEDPVAVVDSDPGQGYEPAI